MVLSIGDVYSQDEYVSIPSGIYTIGKKDHLLNPLRKVTLDSFRICKTEVTNKQFADFVKASGYVTDAEKGIHALVFHPPQGEFQWSADSTANWHFPNGI